MTFTIPLSQTGDLADHIKAVTEFLSDFTGVRVLKNHRLRVAVVMCPSPLEADVRAKFYLFGEDLDGHLA